ncbi:MAG: hypothetical protein WDW38_006404 [Sanguina aurantia]
MLYPDAGPSFPSCLCDYSHSGSDGWSTSASGSASASPISAAPQVGYFGASSKMRADAVLDSVIRGLLVTMDQLLQLRDAHRMVIRILDQLPRTAASAPFPVDIEAFVAAFIGMKAECTGSPLPLLRLSAFTSVSVDLLKDLEVAMLQAVDWNLYQGVLTLDAMY